MDYRTLAQFLAHPSNGSIRGRDALVLVQSEGFPATAWRPFAYDWATADVLTWAGMTAPTVTALVPSSAVIGAASFTLSVQGTGFTEGAEILWNGAPEPTTRVSATELTTGVDMATATTPMLIPVAARVAGVLVTNSLPFDLQPALGADPLAADLCRPK